MASPHIDLDGIFGALYIGMVVANTLYGISIVQAFIYYRNQNDSWFLKSLVTAVMIFETMNQALITHTVYVYTISNWGNVAVLNELVSTLIIANVPNSLTGLLVQGFLTVRVWRLSGRNIFLTAVIVLFVLAEFASVTAFNVMTLQMKTVVQLLAFKSLSLIVVLLSAVGDVLIAAALCILLHRSRSGLRRLDTLINRLILFTVNTGLITSLCAVASFISYMASPHTFIYVAFYFSIGRLYTNALLATLNARKMLCEGSHISGSSDKMRVPMHEFSESEFASRQRSISIKINPTKEFVTSLQEQDLACGKVETSSSNDAAEKREIV